MFYTFSCMNLHRTHVDISKPITIHSREDCRMSIQRWIFGIVALFVMTASMTLPPEATAGDLLLEILLEKGILTKDELIRLKAEEKKREAAQAAEQAKKKPEVKVDVVKEKQQTVKAAKQDKEKSGVKVGIGKKGVTLATADG